MGVVERYFRQAPAYGAEGIVVKSAEGPYQAGKRAWHWIKFKREYQKQLADVVVGRLAAKAIGREVMARCFWPLLILQRTNIFFLTNVVSLRHAPARSMTGVWVI